MTDRPTTRSQALFREAEKVLVGGVNSPVRAFKVVGVEPLVIERAQGSHLWDADGNQYLDYVCSWGAMILGHAHPAVTAAIRDQARRGTGYGMTTELEIALGRAITRALPAIERIRFVSSGTEATMSAIRVARAYTRRDLIVQFEGCYHGHGDSFLSQAGSGLATLGIAASPGVPQSLAELTLNVPFNDSAAVQRVFQEHPDRIAGVIVEPVAANMGVVPPAPGFLEDLRTLTRKHGALLIFDEVISGFRIAYGGAQTIFHVTPDLTTLGKIIGGGLPAAAYGGRSDVMQLVAPLGPVYQAGTLSGNPLAMRAGLAALEILEASGFYDSLHKKSERLFNGLAEAVALKGVSAQINRFGSLATIFFSKDPVRDYQGAKKSDTGRFAVFFSEMLDRGVLLPPSQFEALFVSAAHTEEEIDRTVAACRASLNSVLSAAVAD